MRTATAWGTQGSGAGELPGDTATGRSKTRKATSVAADEAGAGGRHGARIGLRERVSDRREKPTGESSGVGGRRGATRPMEWTVSPQEWGGEEGGA